jgi:aromatic-amino-acid transaminase
MSETGAMSMPSSVFGPIEFFAGDPILSLNDAFQVDGRANKVNLSIGVYTDENGKLPVLPSVLAAAQSVGFAARPYLPMEGHGVYRTGVQNLVFGADHSAIAAGRITTIQTIGGTGAVGIAADFLAKHTPGRAVYVSDPTWDNHHGLFQRAGFTTTRYPYWGSQSGLPVGKEATGGTRSEAEMGPARTIRDSVNGAACTDRAVEVLSAAPKGSIIILQPVCHNPTGVDLSREQQDTITQLCLANEHIVLFDMAYQGFGDGLDEDASWIRRCASDGLSFMVANSFSKNFSLYGERCGGLSVVTQSPEEADLVLGQLKLAVRRSYSNPPTTGTLIVSEVLNTPALRTMWESEVGEMRVRMATMRTRLFDAIGALDSSLDVGFLLTQRGMFSYTGLSSEAVTRMRERDGVYLIATGRVCIAGLNERVIEPVAASLVTELQAVKS